MAKDYKKGDDYKFYLNAGSQATPTWALIKAVTDLAFDPAKADIVIQEAGSSDGHLHGYGDPVISGKFWEDVGDANIETLFAASESGDMKEVAIANGPIATAGTKFWRLESAIFGPLAAARGEGANRTLEFKRHANSDFDITKTTVS